jgi:hypothetical protein
MMPGSVDALTKFINEFGLKKANGTTVFPAIIHYRSNDYTQLFESEVQIITGNDLFTVYIMNTDTSYRYIPDMFEAKNTSMTFRKGEHLGITGNDDGAGNYSVTIFPKPL